MHSVEDVDSTDQPTVAVAVPAPSGKRPGRRPRLTESEQEEVVRLYREATTSTAEIRDRFGIGDSSLYRLLQKHGVPLRGRAPTATSSTTPAATSATRPASSGSTSTRSSTTSSRTRRSTRTRAASPRAVKAPAPTATPVSSGSGAPATASASSNGAVHTFSVSFRAVRIVEADSVLDVVREVERLGATDIEEISRQ